MKPKSYGVVLALRLRSAFVERKRKLICEALAEKKTPKKALASLERLYERQTREFLRCEPTTYREWLEHGPKGELEEVREAVRLDHVWDQLVERASRDVARAIGGAS